MSFTVAIHLHSKTDELITNINIIKKLWKSQDVKLSVHCNDSDSKEIVQGLEIDTLDTTDIIFSENKKLNQRLRCHDTVTRSILNADTDYVVQWHSDAYVIDDSFIIETIKKMKDENISVAARGRGFNFKSNKCPFGDIDDHFMIWKRSEFEEKMLVNLEEAAKFLSVYANETLWAYLIRENFTDDEILIYDNFSRNRTIFSDENKENTDKDGFYEDRIDHRNLHPYNIDEERKLFHIGDKKMTEALLSKFGNFQKIIHNSGKVNKPKYSA